MGLTPSRFVDLAGHGNVHRLLKISGSVRSSCRVARELTRASIANSLSAVFRIIVKHQFGISASSIQVGWKNIV